MGDTFCTKSDLYFIEDSILSVKIIVFESTNTEKNDPMPLKKANAHILNKCESHHQDSCWNSDTFSLLTMDLTQETWLQYDGAPLHLTLYFQHLLRSHYDHHTITRGFSNCFAEGFGKLLYNPDLSPFDIL